MRTFHRLYDQWLQQSPLLTKIGTSAVLFGLGDRIAQRLEGEEQSNSTTRTVRMMVWGGLCFAPIGHVWYNALDRMIVGSSKRAIVQKIALDQFVFTPPLTMAFFTTTRVMEKQTIRSFPDALDDAKRKLWPTLQVNWTVWPLIHVCTFGFVPLPYRILFINCMSIGWSAFLSGMSHQRTIEDDVA